jgi:hypothetical protein
VSGGELREVRNYLVIDLEATTDDGDDDARCAARRERSRSLFASEAWTANVAQADHRELEERLQRTRAVCCGGHRGQPVERERRESVDHGPGLQFGAGPQLRCEEPIGDEGVE